MSFSELLLKTIVIYGLQRFKNNLEKLLTIKIIYVIIGYTKNQKRKDTYMTIYNWTQDDKQPNVYYLNCNTLQNAVQFNVTDRCDYCITINKQGRGKYFVYADEHTSDDMYDENCQFVKREKGTKYEKGEPYFTNLKAATLFAEEFAENFVRCQIDIIQEEMYENDPTDMIPPSNFTADAEMVKSVQEYLYEQSIQQAKQQAGEQPMLFINKQSTITDTLTTLGYTYALHPGTASLYKGNTEIRISSGYIWQWLFSTNQIAYETGIKSREDLKYIFSESSITEEGIEIISIEVEVKPVEVEEIKEEVTPEPEAIEETTPEITEDISDIFSIDTIDQQLYTDTEISLDDMVGEDIIDQQLYADNINPTLKITQSENSFEARWEVDNIPCWFGLTIQENKEDKKGYYLLIGSSPRMSDKIKDHKNKADLEYVQKHETLRSAKISFDGNIKCFKERLDYYTS
ncbi:MAG TPA: hypothetical protein V6C58_06195 [Allocoleopsis sp.]